MTQHKDIFISFSNKDIDKVTKIVTTINFFGVSCWFQLRDSKQHFIDEINKGINNSSNFVIFLSNSSISSFMVKNEISRAIDQVEKNPNYHIIPVVIEEIDKKNIEVIKLLLGSLNWIYESKYSKNEELVLAIFEQANLEIQNNASIHSIYSVENDVEKKRLESQNRLYNEYAKIYLDEIFSEYENPNILDVGCDNGSNILLRLMGRNYKTLLGVDKNQIRINEANVHNSNEKNTFIACDVTSNDFFMLLFSYMQKNGIIGFDIIHISSVLLHLEKPLDLLKTLHTVLNNGGSIFIQDEDDGLNIVDPISTFFENCFYVWSHSFESGDRKFARKLPLLLKSSGFSNIKLKHTTISSIDFDGKYKEELWDLYFNPELWASDSAKYFDNYEAFSLLDRIKEKHSEIKESYMKGKIFLALGVFIITAKK